MPTKTTSLLDLPAQTVAADPRSTQLARAIQTGCRYSKYSILRALEESDGTVRQALESALRGWDIEDDMDVFLERVGAIGARDPEGRIAVLERDLQTARVELVAWRNSFAATSMSDPKPRFKETDNE